MQPLVIETFLTGPEGRFVTAERLQADPALLGGREVDIGTNPNGGLTITDDIELVIVEDSLPDAASFFLEELPDVLRAGQGATYQFRTGGETTAIDVNGETATITGYNGKQIETTVPVLLDALAEAQRGYDALLRLTGQKA